MKKYIFLTAILFTVLSTASYAQSWSLTGNSGTTAPTNFVGTKDNQALVFKTNNAERLRILANGKIGIGTTNPAQKLDVNGNINILKGFGLYMENHPVLRVDSARSNVFLGNSTGIKTTGTYNTALGYLALNTNTSGYSNTATGAFSLSLNTTGSQNMANGHYALYVNSTGNNNTAAGYAAMFSNTEGSQNTASGQGALTLNTTGSFNTAIGSNALFSNSTASYNTAMGYSALANSPTGNRNVAIGTYALAYNNGAWGNTAVGDYAGGKFLHGWNNTFIGSDADATANSIYNSVALGNSAKVTAANQVRLGNSYTNSIGGFANWTNISDGRVKKNIKENVPGLLFINKLKPVTYNLDLDAADKIAARNAATGKDARMNDSLAKGKFAPAQPTQMEIAARNAKQQVVYTGFVAQEVEKAAKELNYDFSGVDAAKNDNDLYGLRYSDFVVPLVKAVQELSKENNDLKKRIEKLEALANTKLPASANQQLNTGSQVTKAVAALLEQNMPNPFNSSTTIRYTLPQQFGAAKIMITDNSGKAIKEIKVTGSGKNSVTVDASALASGTYQYSLVVDGVMLATRQMMIMK